MSLFANCLGLASSIYAIQIFNRYIGYGLDGTLLTLTSGALVAVVLELLLRRARYRLIASGLMLSEARAVFGAASASLADSGAEQEASRFNRKNRRGNNEHISPQSVATLFDAPFALLFVAVIAMLNPFIGLLVFMIAVAYLLLAHWRSIAIADLQEQWKPTSVVLDSELDNCQQANMVRQFGLAEGILLRLRSALVSQLQARFQFLEAQFGLNNAVQSMQALTSVTVICTGALAVTAGELDIGSLIGINILAGRAINLVVQGQRVHYQLQENAPSAEPGKAASADDRQLLLPEFSGRIGLKNIGYRHDPRLAPLFSHLSIDIAPGEVVLFCGDSGTGKSTLARLLVGQIAVQEGHILVDGVDLQQYEPAEWHRNVSYVAAEPSFLPVSIRDNFRVFGRELDEEALRQVLRKVGLNKLIDHHPEGLDQVLHGGGINLPPGIRKRLALARALVVDAPCFVLDEAHLGLDASGLQCLSAVMAELIEAGKTLLVFSHDPAILKGKLRRVDLNCKPVPLVRTA